MIKLRVNTIEGKVFKADNIKSVTLPTAAGEITVLSRHIPLTTLLKSGVIKVIDNEKSETFLAVSGGLLEVRSHNNGFSEVIILAHSADLAEDLVHDVVETARNRAKEALLKPESLSPEEYANLVKDLDIEEARIKALSRL